MKDFVYKLFRMILFSPILILFTPFIVLNCMFENWSYENFITDLKQVLLPMWWEV